VKREPVSKEGIAQAKTELIADHLAGNGVSVKVFSTSETYNSSKVLTTSVPILLSHLKLAAVADLVVPI
jgi:hypothetical protein